MTQDNFMVTECFKVLDGTSPRKLIAVSVGCIAATMQPIGFSTPAYAQTENVRPIENPAFERFKELAFKWQTSNDEFQKAIKLCDIKSAKAHYQELQDLFRQFRQMDNAIKLVGTDRPDFGLSSTVGYARGQLVLRETEIRKAEFACRKKDEGAIPASSEPVPANSGKPEPETIKSNLPKDASLKNRSDEASAQHTLATMDCNEAEAAAWLKELDSIVDEYRGKSKADGAKEADSKAYRDAKEMLDRAKRLHKSCGYKPISEPAADPKPDADKPASNQDSQSSRPQGSSPNNVVNRTSIPQSAAQKEAADRSRGERFNTRVDQLLAQLAETKTAYLAARREGNEEQIKALGDELLDINDQYRNLAILINSNVPLGTVNDAVENKLRGTSIPENIDEQDLIMLNALSEEARASVIEDRRAAEESPGDQSAVRQPQDNLASRSSDCRSSSSCSSGGISGSLGFGTSELPPSGIGFRRSGPVGTAAEEFALQSDTSIETFGGSVNVNVGNLQFDFGYVEGSSVRAATIEPNSGVDSGIVFSELRSGSSGVSGGQLGGMASFNTDINSFSASAGLCIVGCDPNDSGPIPIPYPSVRLPQDGKKVTVRGAKLALKASANITDTRHRGTFDTQFSLPGFSGSFGQTRDTQISEDRFGVSLDGSVALGCPTNRLCPYVGGHAGVHFTDVKIGAAERNMASFVPAADRDFTLNIDESDNRVGVHGGFRVGVNYAISKGIEGGNSSSVVLNVEGRCDFVSDVTSVGFNNSGDQTLAGETTQFGRRSSFSCGSSVGVKVPF
ncbi:MAG: hypothetical protein ABJN65_15315 [Parasphingorhabdus sp.]